MLSKENPSINPVYGLGYDAGYALAFRAAHQALPPGLAAQHGVQSAVITFPDVFHPQWVRDYQAGHGVGQFEGYRDATALAAQQGAASQGSVQPNPTAQPNPPVQPEFPRAMADPFVLPPELPSESKGFGLPGNLGLNLLLFVGAGLIVAAATVMISVMGGEVSKFAGILALAGGTYSLGLVLFCKVKRLRPAGVTFLGIGLASIPLAGVACTYYLDVPSTTSWLASSIVAVVAFGVATVLTRSEFVAYFTVLATVSTVTSPMAGFASHALWQLAAVLVFATALSLLNRFARHQLPAYLQRPVHVSGASLALLVLAIVVFGQPFLPGLQAEILLLLTAANFAVTALVTPTEQCLRRTAYSAAARAIAIWAALAWAAKLDASVPTLAALALAMGAANVLISAELLKRWGHRLDTLSREGGAAEALADTTRSVDAHTALPPSQPAPLAVPFRSAQLVEALLLIVSLGGVAFTHAFVNYAPNTYGEFGESVEYVAATGAVPGLLGYLPALVLVACGAYLVFRVRNAWWGLGCALGVLLLGDAVNVSTGELVHGGLVSLGAAIVLTIASVALRDRLKSRVAARHCMGISLAVWALSATWLSPDAGHGVLCLFFLGFAGILAVAHYSLRIWWALIPAPVMAVLGAYHGFVPSLQSDLSLYLALVSTGGLLLIVQQSLCARRADGTPSPQLHQLRSSVLFYGGISLSVVGGLLAPLMIKGDYPSEIEVATLGYAVGATALPALAAISQSLRLGMTPVVRQSRHMLLLVGFALPALAALWASVHTLSAWAVLAGVTALTLVAFVNVLATGRLAERWNALDSAVGLTPKAPAGSAADTPPMTVLSVALVALLVVGGSAAMNQGNIAVGVFLIEMLIVLTCSVLLNFTLGRWVAIVGLLISVLYLARESTWIVMMLAGFAIIALVIVALLRSGRQGGPAVPPAPVGPPAQPAPFAQPAQPAPFAQPAQQVQPTQPVRPEPAQPE